MRFIDLAGQRFGRLLVLKRDGYFKNGKIECIGWLCKCDCGNIKRLRGSVLKNGSTRSCGCLHLEITKTNRFKPKEGVCEICGERFIYRASSVDGKRKKTCSRDCHNKRRAKYQANLVNKDFKHFLTKLARSVRTRAARENIRYDLSTDFILNLFAEQNGKCKMTGVPFELNQRRGRTNISPRLPSIDKIEPAKGYIKSNVQLVCFMYNQAKDVWTDNDVLKFAKALVAHQKANKKQGKKEHVDIEMDF